MLPAEVRDELDGTPVAGTWEPVFPLLTADPGGEPRVCLLSRAELVPRPDLVLCAVRSRRTAANLRRTGVATLLVVTGTVSWSVRLRAGRETTDDGALAVELFVTGVERDTLGIPLRPMTYLADAALAATERWDSNAVLFARLAPEETLQRRPTHE